jgi:hypothetical protein
LYRLRTSRAHWLWILVAAPLLLAACGSPTGPDDGNVGDPPSDTIDTAEPPPPPEPPLPGTPLLPVPSGPLVDAPPTSDTLTLIVPLATNYRPLVDRMRGIWTLRARECRAIAGAFSCGIWTSRAVTAPAWSDALGTTRMGLFDLPMTLSPPAGRPLLVQGGTPVNPVRVEVSSTVGGSLVRFDRIHQFVGEPLDQVVHLRRDRFWELLPISSGVGSYLLLTGDTQAELSTTYTSGTTTTETQTFGSTVTATAGLDLGPLSAGVSTALSESYSTSVSITESVSETFTRIARGSSGTTTRFMIWGLVERYTSTDENGEAIEHPDYEIVPDTLYRRGVATALQATEFPG